MNFQELMQKMAELDQPIAENDNVQEETIDECGMDMSPSMSSKPEQQDSVTMNISMNGSGKGGIRDILDILRNIEGEEDNEMDMPVVIKPMGGMDMGIEKEELANSPDEVYGTVGDVIPSGNDLHASHDSYSDKPYRGDNPMAVESIKTRLDTLYQEIKGR